MQILVKSGGFPPEKDYSWVCSESYRIGDSLLTEFSVNELFDDRVLSVVLARKEGMLLLLVSGMKSDRTDYRGRQIRNMVAWRCREHEEKELRSLAVLAIGNLEELEKRFDKAVTRDDASPNGFKVQWEQIQAIRGEKVSERNDDVESSTCKFARDSKERRDDLIESLKNGNIPSRDGPLVVVTGNVGQDKLELRQVWRGLTSLVPGEDWAEKKKKAKFTNFLRTHLALTLFGILGIGFAVAFAVYMTKLASSLAKPSVTRVAVTHGQKETNRWNQGTDAKLTIHLQEGKATMIVTFDEPMDLTTMPSVTWSHLSITSGPIAWLPDGNSCSFQINSSEDNESRSEGTLSLKISGAKNRGGYLMQPLEVPVLILDMF